MPTGGFMRHSQEQRQPLYANEQNPSRIAKWILSQGAGQSLHPDQKGFSVLALKSLTPLNGVANFTL